MGVFYDLYFGSRKKKRCTVCGCVLLDDSDSDICEVCLDELYASDRGKRCIECGCIMPESHEADTCEVCSEEMGGLNSDKVIAKEVDK